MLGAAGVEWPSLLARLQGAMPQQAHVVAPHHRFVPESYRLDDYAAYYRLVKKRLEAALAERDAKTYPEPAQHCDVCNWWVQCNAQRRSDDHLCFVAGISRLQIKELRTRLDVNTLERLGDLKDVPKPKRGSREALERVRDQAAIQLKARRTHERQRRVVSFLDLEAERIHARPSERDPKRAGRFRLARQDAGEHNSLGSARSSGRRQHPHRAREE